MTIRKPRSLVSDAAANAWDDAYDMKVRQHSRPVEIEIPIVSAALFIGIAVSLAVAMLLILPSVGG